MNYHTHYFDLRHYHFSADVQNVVAKFIGRVCDVTYAGKEALRGICPLLASATLGQICSPSETCPSMRMDVPRNKLHDCLYNLRHPVCPVVAGDHRQSVAAAGGFAAAPSARARLSRPTAWVRLL